MDPAAQQIGPTPSNPTIVPVEFVVHVPESSKITLHVPLAPDKDSAMVMPGIFMGWVSTSSTLYWRRTLQKRWQDVSLVVELLTTLRNPGFWTVAGAVGAGEEEGQL